MTDTGSSEPVTLDGSCHCGAVRFTVLLPFGLASARRCTCSLCRMRGAVALTAKVGGLAVSHGEDKLATYRFNTGAAEHHFCRVCGIYTHHKRRSNPEEFGVNAACLEGISPFDFREIVVHDGERHPSDQPDGKSRIAGVLRFDVSKTDTANVSR